MEHKLAFPQRSLCGVFDCSIALSLSISVLYVSLSHLTHPYSHVLYLSLSRANTSVHTSQAKDENNKNRTTGGDEWEVKVNLKVWEDGSDEITFKKVHGVTVEDNEDGTYLCRFTAQVRPARLLSLFSLSSLYMPSSFTVLFFLDQTCALI